MRRRGETLLVLLVAVVVLQLATHKGQSIRVEGIEVSVEGKDIINNVTNNNTNNPLDALKKHLKHRLSHAKELLRERINHWLNARHENRLHKQLQQAKMIEQRMEATTPAPSSQWMHLMRDVLANMTPAGNTSNIFLLSFTFLFINAVLFFRYHLPRYA